MFVILSFEAALITSRREKKKKKEFHLLNTVTPHQIYILELKGRIDLLDLDLLVYYMTPFLIPTTL